MVEGQQFTCIMQDSILQSIIMSVDICTYTKLLKSIAALRVLQLIWVQTNCHHQLESARRQHI